MILSANYSGNSYVRKSRGRLYDLEMNLFKLHQFRCIDNRTQVVIIEQSLHNRNSQLLISVALLAEIFSTDKIFLVLFNNLKRDFDN